MTDTKITIVCREGEDHITEISFTAERNYAPIFTEAFSTQEKPLNVYLIKDKDTSIERIKFSIMRAKELRIPLAKHFGLTEEEMNAWYPSGKG